MQRGRRAALSTFEMKGGKVTDNTASKNGGGVTASAYGQKLRGALNSKNLNASDLSNWSHSASPSKLVSWVESHDNYANGDYESTRMSEWQMTMGWGVIGSRSQTMPLYFDRPVGSGGSQPQFAEKSKLGDAGACIKTVRGIGYKLEDKQA